MKKKILFLFYRAPVIEIPEYGQGFFFNILNEAYDCRALVLGKGKSKGGDKIIYSGNNAGFGGKIFKFIFGFQSQRITHFCSGEYFRKYKEILGRFKPDIVYVEHSLMMQYVMKYKPGNAKVILFDDESALYIRKNKLRNNISERVRNYGLGIYKLKSCSYADKVITITDEEKENLRRVGACNVVSILYAIDSEYFSYNFKAAEKSNKILFVGNFMHYPNREAVKILINKILPNVNKTDAFKLIIAGRNTNLISKYANEYIEIYDDVKDIRNFYYESAFLVAPVFSGGGMRTKVLGPASCGLPVLMTPLANLGFNFRNKKEAFIAENAESFVHNINFMTDPMNRSLLEEVSRNARRITEERFALSIVKEMILREFSGVIG